MLILLTKNSIEMLQPYGRTDNEHTVYLLILSCYNSEHVTTT